MNEYGYTVLCQPDRGADDPQGIEVDHEYVIDIHLSVAVTINPNKDNLDEWLMVLAENAADAMLARDGIADCIDGWHVLEDNGPTDENGEPL